MSKFRFRQTARADLQFSSATGQSSTSPTKPGWTLRIAIGGFGAALFGVYWDDAWHTDRGRDELLSLPHLVLYLGVSVTLTIVLSWAWLDRSASWSKVLSGGSGLALLGAAVTVGSAPVDEWWHSSFGRDAVLWSPPHLLALVGTIALGTGVVFVAAGEVGAKLQPYGVASCVAAGAGVIGGWQVLVLEYDTDVPQFSPFWYLPVMAVAISLAALTVQAAFASRIRRPAFRSSLLYTGAMIIVIVILWSLKFSTAIVPLVAPAMLAADVTRERGIGLAGRTSALVMVMFATYLPYLYIVPGAVTPSVGDAAAGVPLAMVAVAATIVVFEPGTRWRVPTMVSSVATAIFLSLAAVLSSSPQAAAHDPGQGVETFEVSISAVVLGQRIDVTTTVDSELTGPLPVRLLARRAGRTVEASLAVVGDTWLGELAVDEDGRWFVYVVARDGADQLEAWLPVIVGSDGSTSKQTSFYILDPDTGTSTSQVVVGAVLIVLALLVVVGISLTVRSLSPAKL